MTVGMGTRGLRAAVLFALAAGLTGCGKGKTEVKDGPPPDVNVGAPPTEAECQAFGKALEDAVAAGDPAAFNALLDWDGLLDRTMFGIEVPGGTAAGFRQGVKQGINNTGIAAEIIRNVAEGGSYKMLRVHTDDGQLRVLIRLVADAGVNYHDVVPARRADGKIRAVDIHVFAAGELLSQTLRRAFLTVLSAQGPKTVVRQAAGWENEFVQNVPKMTEMTRKIREGDSKGALAIFDQLPASLRKDKMFLLLRMRAAQAVDDAEYAKTLEALRTNHPTDPCVDFHSIDYHLLGKRYKEALECVDRVEKSLGGDPYLQVLRAGLHIEAKDFAAAHKVADAALAADPGMKEVYWMLVNLSLAEKKFDDTAKWLDTLTTKFKIEMNDLVGQAQYADFVKSPQYQTWMKKRGK